MRHRIVGQLVGGACPGHVQADVVHERLVAVGFDGDERTTQNPRAAWRPACRSPRPT